MEGFKEESVAAGAGGEEEEVVGRSGLLNEDLDYCGFGWVGRWMRG